MAHPLTQAQHLNIVPMERSISLHMGGTATLGNHCILPETASYTLWVSECDLRVLCGCSSKTSNEHGVKSLFFVAFRKRAMLVEYQCSLVLLDESHCGPLRPLQGYGV